MSRKEARAEYEARQAQKCKRCGLERWKHSIWSPKELRTATCEGFIAND